MSTLFHEFNPHKDYPAVCRDCGRGRGHLYHNACPKCDGKGLVLGGVCDICEGTGRDPNGYR